MKKAYVVNTLTTAQDIYYLEDSEVIDYLNNGYALSLRKPNRMVELYILAYKVADELISLKKIDASDDSIIVAIENIAYDWRGNSDPPTDYRSFVESELVNLFGVSDVRKMSTSDEKEKTTKTTNSYPPTW